MMIEEVVLNYLLNDKHINAYAEKPKDPDARYVLIERTGGSVSNHIKSATFAIQSVADTLLKAALLNEEVKTAMEEIVKLDSIAGCSLNSDYNFTNTQTKEYRYQAVFNLTYY